MKFAIRFAVAVAGLSFAVCATNSSAQVSDAAESACMVAVNNNYGGNVGNLIVVNSEFSEANSLVMIDADGERWRCLVSNDGVVQDLSVEQGTRGSGSQQVAGSNEQDAAVQLCMNQIRDVYSVDQFRNVWAEQEGHHKFKVQGNVKYQHDKYPFDCKIKRGQVKSYHYDGPHPGAAGDDGGDHDKLGTALAVGAGLAIIAALANAGGDNQNTAPEADQLTLEDECHDELSYRLRDERHNTANVRLDSSLIKGSTLTGDATIKFDHYRPQRATYVCHFNRSGHVTDSSYQLY